MIAVLIAIAAGLASPASPDTQGVPRPVSAVAGLDSSRTQTMPAKPSSSPAPDSTARAALPFQLRREGGIDHLSASEATPVDPGGLALDAFGNVWVSDQVQRRLLRYDRSGRPLSESGSMGDDPVRLRRPAGIAPAGAIAMAVLDELNRRIVTYDLFGQFQGVLALIDSAATRAGSGETTPVALASDRSGALYVADAAQDRVLVFDPRGALARIVAGHGSGAGSFHGIAGLAVGRRGDLVVSESGAGRIQRLDPSGAVRASWRLPQKPAGTRLPLAMDDSLRVAVGDAQGRAIWLFDPDGRLLGVSEAFDQPVALYFHRDGSLWVAERGARRVSRVVLSSTAPRPGD